MLSVIICTHNPRPDLLRWTLESLANQTLPLDEWELVIVDNRSTAPLESASSLPAALAPITRLLREEEVGLSAARCAGIAQCRGDVLVFVDDDNRLAPDYLAVAADLARTNPELGCFGGKAFPHFECVPPAWLGPLLPNLGLRDYGEEPIISRDSHWGPWEPIGAGMVVRREVAVDFARYFAAQREARELGRRGESLASCEDSLIAHLSLRLGFANAYQPRLSLIHFIKDFRTRPSYLARLMLALGDSYRRLLALKGSPVAEAETRSEWERLAALLPYRIETQGDAGYIQWLWDLGHAGPSLAKSWPRISVVMPTFNSGTTLRRALESLQAQAYPALELIIQDGGSTDDTIAIAREYPRLVTRLISERDTGQADALNRGFGHATGAIEAWLCSDDEYRPGILYYVALQFLLHPATEFLAGGTLRVFPDGSQAQVRPAVEQLPTLGYHNFIDQPSTFWRRELRLRAGPIDQRLHFAFDWEYWNRFVRHRAVTRTVSEILSVYHFSDSNKTSVAGSRQVPELVQVVREYGPMEGKLARIYQLLYYRFDLAGCYDSPPSAPPARMRKFERVLGGLVARYGRDLIHSYNWTYASRQQRNLVWYK